MTNISPRPAAGTAFLALSCVGLLTSAAQAAEPPVDAARAPAAMEQEKRIERDDIIVNGKIIPATTLESPKATRDLIDTTQTITVIGDQTIRKQNLLTLRDVLQTIPGITFGAGEGGGGYGDSINLRGYSANNDITIDGVRDSAQYSRSETFNLQQVEVYNGANSVFGGGGSVGGTINLVTKRPQAENLTVVSGGIGSDDYYRATVDANVRVSDLVAVRLNAVGHKNDIPGRDVERNKRWAVAPSLMVGVEGPTSLTLQYYHQEDDNVPVFGVPYYRSATFSGLLPGTDRKGYYGIVNLDKQDITVDQGTATISHRFSDKVSIRNLSRWQRVAQDSTTSAPQGVLCLTNNRTPTGAACTVSFTAPVLYEGVLRPATTAAPFIVTVQPGSFLGNGPRGLVRNQENQLLYNQTDLRAVFNTGGLEHTLVIGASLSKEDYTLFTGNTLRTAVGVTVLQSPISLADPDTTYTGPFNFIPSGRSQGITTNAAGYLFDTVKIVPQLEVNVGLRYEHAEGRFRADTFSTVVGLTRGDYTRGASQVSDETLFSYRGGINFKPVETVSLYASYGNSTTPTSATVRLGCGTLISAPAGQLDPCDIKPEKAVNYEIGAKADLFGRKLQLTAALFRNERTNYRVATNDPIVTTLAVTDGRSRVDGIALGASGSVSKAWSIFANYTYLDGTVLQSVSNFCLANPGTRGTTTITNPCGNSAAVLDPQKDQQLTNTPKHSGSLFTTYTLPFGLQVGYGLTYQGAFALNNSALATPLAPTTALTPVFHSEDYLTHRAFLSYTIGSGLTAQLNVQNFTNEKYFTGIRNNGWATPGEARSVRFTMFYSL